MLTQMRVFRNEPQLQYFGMGAGASLVFLCGACAIAMSPGIWPGSPAMEAKGQAANVEAAPAKNVRRDAEVVSTIVMPRTAWVRLE